MTKATKPTKPAAEAPERGRPHKTVNPFSYRPNSKTTAAQFDFLATMLERAEYIVTRVYIDLSERHAETEGGDFLEFELAQLDALMCYLSKATEHARWSRERQNKPEMPKK